MHVDIVKLFTIFWFDGALIFHICDIKWWLTHLANVHLLFVFFPPVGDVEVLPAHQESQSDHHQHEGQDGPEVSEKLFIHKMVLNSLRPERDLR